MIGDGKVTISFEDDLSLIKQDYNITRMIHHLTS